MPSKTEVKAAAKELVADALTIIESAQGNIDRIRTRYLNDVGVFEVQVGVGLDIIRQTMTAAKGQKVDLSGTVLIDGVKSAKWVDVANAAVPGKSRPTLYRWTNAGAVARVLDDAVGAALIGSLVPLYRILTAASTPEDLQAAQELVRTVYAECVAAAGLDDEGRPVPPTEQDVHAAAEAACPTNRTGGGGGGTEAADDDDDESGRENANAADETFTFTGSAEELLNIRNTVGAFVKKTSDEHEVPPVLVQTILVWGAMAAKAHGGPDAILAALSA